jgi:ABC-type glycerol-3-phosphate transport system substrate-binding protein
MNRRRFTIAAAVLSVATLLLSACGGDDDAGSGDQTIELEFSSYAWQDPTVKATKDIVAAWNTAHPKIQVKYIPVDAGSVHDKLVTQFAGGSAPDVIHDEAADLVGFANQGYLADMTKLIPADLKSAIPQGIWDSVTFSGKVYAVPTLLQSYVVFVNKAMLTQAGITLPTADNPWTWDQFQQHARQLTNANTFGLGWGLKSPVAAVLSLSMNFNGKFVYGDGANSTVKFDAGERQVPNRIRQMLTADRSLAPTTIGMTGSDVLPGFYAGKYAMIVGGNFASQQLSEQAPAGFQWQMLPMLKGDSQQQAANPQTLSVAAESKHQKEAAEFAAFYANASNLAKLAQGDWLIPASDPAAKEVATATGGKNGWDIMATMGKNLTVAPFQSAAAYPEWKTKVATPALQEYLGGKITIDQLGEKLTSGWKPSR